MRVHVKEILIGLYVLSGIRSAADRVFSLGLSKELLFYCGLAAILIATLVATAFVRAAALRTIYALLFFCAAFFIGTVETATAEHLTYDVFVMLMQSRSSAADALDQYGPAVALGFVTSLPLLFGIAIPADRSTRMSRVAAAAPPIGVALLSTILFLRGGDGARGLPGAFTPLAYASLLAYETGSVGGAVREEVRLPVIAPPARRDIVLIIDESVLATYLDLTRAGGIRSGLLHRRPALAVRNYGYAAAISNCSVGTNVTLRYGGTREDYQRINATMPSIWAYAHRAGLRTVYIDAQRTGGHLHSNMTGEERVEIDEFIQFDLVPVRDRDMAAADRLAAFLENDRAEFVLVNKVGAHFPVHDKYPDSFMSYRPALPRGLFERISDTGNRDGFGGSVEDWRRYRNAYRNTLLWNVGAFFDRLLSRTDLSRATLIYTSDHGQDLHENGSPGVTTHCSTDPVDEEGLIPLVVLEGPDSRSLDWERWFARNRNRSSHYNIFPTLLALMGYDRRAVASTYGRSLAEPTLDSFTFNSRFNARLGQRPLWRRIELERLARSNEGEATSRTAESVGLGAPNFGGADGGSAGRVEARGAGEM